MAPRKTIWYHLGYALERARQPAAVSRKGLVGLAERRSAPVDERREDSPAEHGSGGLGSLLALPGGDELVSAAVAMVVDRALGGWGKRRKTTFSSLIRAGAAGAAAALLVDLLRPLLHGRAELPVLDGGTSERMLAGVGQGLVYGGVVEPRLPGPALLKGAVYGSAEYAADPLGGLSGVLGSHAPQGRIPVLADAIEGLDAHDRAYLEHVLFGIALALIYGSSPPSSGILPDEE